MFKVFIFWTLHSPDGASSSIYISFCAQENISVWKKNVGNSYKRSVVYAFQLLDILLSRWRRFFHIFSFEWSRQLCITLSNRSGLTVTKSFCIAVFNSFRVLSLGFNNLAFSLHHKLHVLYIDPFLKYIKQFDHGSGLCTVGPTFTLFINSKSIVSCN